MPQPIIPAVPDTESPDLQGNRTGSGDGGNRTHERVPPSRIPLHDRSGTVVAYALVDREDASFADLRWYLDSGGPARSGKPYVRRGGKRDGKPWARYLHREILGLEPGDPRRADHVNGNTLDNRRANLRIVTTAQNAQNQGSRGGSSRFRGVTWDKSRGKWMATGMLDGRRRTIGRFDDEADAAFAAAEWRAEHMPFSEEAAA